MPGSPISTKPAGIPLAAEVSLAAHIAAMLHAAGIDPDDPDFAELLASECDVQERLCRIVRAARHASAHADALDDMLKGMRARKARLQTKAERLRGIVASAMGECGLKRLDAPDFSASLGAGKPKIVITDEDALPASCFVTHRVISMTALRERLDADADCPGATLSNGAPTLTVRTR